MFLKPHWYLEGEINPWANDSGFESVYSYGPIEEKNVRKTLKKIEKKLNQAIKEIEAQPVQSVPPVFDMLSEKLDSIEIRLKEAQAIKASVLRAQEEKLRELKNKIRLIIFVMLHDE